MLVMDVAKRSTAEQLLQHAWFKTQAASVESASNPMGSLMMQRLKQFGGMQRMKRLALKCLVCTLNNRDVKRLLVRLSCFKDRELGDFLETEVYVRTPECKTRMSWSGTCVTDTLVSTKIYNNHLTDVCAKTDALFKRCRCDVQELFEANDPEKTGRLDRDSFHQALERVGATIEFEELESLLELDPAIDADGMIDYNDFVAAMLDTDRVSKKREAVCCFCHQTPLKCVWDALIL